MANQAPKIHARQKQLQRNLKKFVTVMGVEATKHFRGSFRKGGFTDDTLHKWQRRKNNRDAGRAILVKTGRLKRSVQVVRRTLTSVTIGSSGDLPYAVVHNDGLRAGRGRGFKMPKRQFIGDSKQLERKLIRELNATVMKSFSNLKR